MDRLWIYLGLQQPTDTSADPALDKFAKGTPPKKAGYKWWQSGPALIEEAEGERKKDKQKKAKTEKKEKPTKDPKPLKDPKPAKAPKAAKEPKAAKPPKEAKPPKQPKTPKDGKPSKEPKESKEDKAAKKSKESKEPTEPKKAKDQKKPKEPKKPKESKKSKESTGPKTDDAKPSRITLFTKPYAPAKPPVNLEKPPNPRTSSHRSIKSFVKKKSEDTDKNKVVPDIASASRPGTPICECPH